MKKWICLSVFLSLIAVTAGCMMQGGRNEAAAQSSVSVETEETADAEENNMQERYQTPDGETGYIYLPSSVTGSEDRTYPLVIMMNGTAQDPVHDAEGTGWVALARREDILLLIPEYDDYETYGNVDTLISVLDYIEDAYPVDRTRVYSTGFSNGGAMSVALAAVYPERFAAISAYGWMVDMRYKDALAERYDMPFLVLQGTREYTETDAAGNPTVMQDEQKAIRSLFLFNEMIEAEDRPDYQKMPYWGYEPSFSSKTERSGSSITINSYLKEGYQNPFAQLIMIDGEIHRVHSYDAELAWDFMQKFMRNKDGSISESQEN
jgi:poly(3-hydroxybutyrate) depolymerase